MAERPNFGDSGVDFHDAGHVEKVRRLFAAANQHRMALIVHLEPGRFYGPAEVEIFLDQIASAAPDVVIQIAHLAGNGPRITSPEAWRHSPGCARRAIREPATSGSTSRGSCTRASPRPTPS